MNKSSIPFPTKQETGNETTRIHISKRKTMMTLLNTPPRQKLVQTIQKLDDCYSGRFLDEIDALAQKLIQDINNKGGEFLHNLDVDRDSTDDVGALIDIIPSALSHMNSKCQLPIHSAANSFKSVTFVPLLAQEGVKRNVGGKRKRGGLLVKDPTTSPGMNVLNQIASLEETVNRDSSLEENVADLETLKVLKDLRQSNLLLKADIYRYDLICWSCFPGCQQIFDYFIEWDPSSLKNDDECYSVILGMLHADCNAMVKKAKSLRFKMALVAGMKYFPDELGLLFLKEHHHYDKKGISKTTFHRAAEMFGEHQALKLIHECIPPSDERPIPILHHVIQHAPEYLNGFAKHYPDAGFLRDHQSRTLTNAILASGRTFEEDPMFYINLPDEKIEDKDMASGLYPFMLAASAEMPDLQTIKYLLRRNPGVLGESHRQQTRCTKRRKRE